MTIAESFGCGLIAFGPPLVMFVMTICKDPLLIIVCFASAFFWMISLLLSAALWMAVVPLRDVISFGLIFSVLFQEGFRFLFYVLIRKAEKGLEKVWQMGAKDKSLFIDINKLSYVAGFGFGTISGVFSLVNLLAAMNGPGTIGLRGDDKNFFIVSAFMALSMVLNHIFWGVLFFDGMRHKKYYQPICVVVLHMVVSVCTLFSLSLSWLGLLVSYLLMLVAMTWSYFVVGGSKEHFLRSFMRNNQQSQLTVT